jgi:DNA polymerase-3 subunit epsilon
MEREVPGEGWYSDPYGEAPQRWWDGTAWTGYTTGPSPTPEPTPVPPLAGFATTGRIAVVDVETTGLYNADRVVEIGIVTLDTSGLVVDEFETLLNPNRDVGPTWLHQITPSMVVSAPEFGDVAGHVAARLDGSVVCAHNLPFDQRMLLNEFSRHGLSVDWGEGLDTLSVTGCKLRIACDEAGISTGDGHRALADARGCAQLLLKYADFFDSVAVPARVGPAAVRPIKVVTRDGTSDAPVDTPFLATLAVNVHAAPDVAPYVDLLDVALADLKLIAEERDELAATASTLGLDAGTVVRAHRDFLSQLIDAAVEDHVVTGDEYDQLCRAAALLEIDADFVNRRTDGLRSDSGLLALGDISTVCFTGEAVDHYGIEIPRSRLEEIARSVGIEPVRSVTKTGCSLLVAADPASRSGKAANARKHGVPICSVDAFLASAQTGARLEVSTLTGAGVALVCTSCGDSWLAARNSSRPLCASCKPSKPSKTPPAAPRPHPAEPSAPAAETLTCADCGRDWARPRARGRKPHRCPDCA